MHLGFGHGSVAADQGKSAGVVGILERSRAERDQGHVAEPAKEGRISGRPEPLLADEPIAGDDPRDRRVAFESTHEIVDSTVSRVKPAKSTLARLMVDESRHLSVEFHEIVPGLHLAVIGDHGHRHSGGNHVEHLPDESVGFSIFWDTPIGPLRLNFAKPLVKETYDLEQTFDLTVSTRF